MRDSEKGKNGGKLSTKRENEYTQQSPVLPDMYPLYWTSSREGVFGALA